MFDGVWDRGYRPAEHDRVKYITAPLYFMTSSKGHLPLSFTVESPSEWAE